MKFTAAKSLLPNERGTVYSTLGIDEKVRFERNQITATPKATLAKAGHILRVTVVGRELAHRPITLIVVLRTGEGETVVTSCATWALSRAWENDLLPADRLFEVWTIGAESFVIAGTS